MGLSHRGRKSGKMYQFINMSKINQFAQWRKGNIPTVRDHLLENTNMRGGNDNCKVSPLFN